MDWWILKKRSMDETPSDLDHIVADARQRHRAGELDAAAELYELILAQLPDHPEVLQLKGILVAQSGEMGKGLELLERAVELAPESGPIRANLAKLRLDLGDVIGAISAYETAHACDPNNPEIAFNLAGALVMSGRQAEAIACLESTLDVAPCHPGILANLGNLYRQNGRYEESRDLLERAVKAAPDDPEMLHSLGVTLSSLREYEGASACFRAALGADPGFIRAAAQLFFAGLHACDWSDYSNLVENFRRLLSADPKLVAELSPFIALFLPFSQDELNLIATARARLSSISAGERTVVPPTPERLRIGYLSADLGSHPVGRLLADVLPRHNAAEFEVTVFTLSSADGSEVQKAIHSGVCRIEDVSRSSAAEVVACIRAADIHILVDLGGFTLGARPEILSARLAPLQVGWLGYCGSMGGLNDVLLADPEVLPPELAPCFHEAVAYLPGSFMPLNRFDQPTASAGTRVDHGLPAEGFVYCAFNAPAKIDPETFAAWMEILAAVDGSVLWVRENAPTTSNNLRAAARLAGINADRLVFAPTEPEMADHLARHCHADLFLDTFVYGAHSTAADAISQGVPVLTRAGPAMPARVGASLCRTYGLGDLVVKSTAEYVATAIAVAADHSRAANYRSVLVSVLDTVETSEKFVRKLESAYEMLWRARCSETLEPGTIIPPGDTS
ncbi:MAG: hypothetical protein CL573_01480 [Alphaproteobacteria bacterium]|nr:hypothetical protein [Alphaproteobacteria bacterium]